MNDPREYWHSVLEEARLAEPLEPLSPRATGAAERALEELRGRAMVRA